MQLTLNEILESAVHKNASDVLFIAGLPVSFKIADRIERQSEERLAPDDTGRLVGEIYEKVPGRDIKPDQALHDDDLSFSIAGLARFRVNVFRQRGSLAAVIRVVTFELPDYKELGIPDEVMVFAEKKKGLVLVSGPAGSGKSTTLACLIDSINQNREDHIITIEDPIEFLHRHKKSVVSQRELNTDTTSYDVALRAAMRQSPDVILVGEMRDYETIRAAITAAETGHLVISTLHTMGASNTVDRILDAFPPTQQQQVRVQLSGTLQGVVSQQLLPAVAGGLVPAFEVMVTNNAIRTMIRESRIHQIDGVIMSSQREGMMLMDNHLVTLVKEGRILADTALQWAVEPERMAQRIKEVL